MPELLYSGRRRFRFDDLGRPDSRLAWDNVDLDVRTLLSFEGLGARASVGLEPVWTLKTP
jgi:hypothetical protein